MSPLCKYCFVQIQWVKRDGKNIPLDPLDRSDHRDTCNPQKKPSRFYANKQEKKTPISENNPVTKTQDELGKNAKVLSVKIRSGYGRAIPEPVRMKFYDELEVELKVSQGLTQEDVSRLQMKLQTEIYKLVEQNIKNRLQELNLPDPLEQ